MTAHEDDHVPCLNWQPSIDRPPDDAVLWRYLSLPKFLDLLHSRRLYFSRISTFNDAFEGTIPLGTVSVWNGVFQSSGHSTPSAAAASLASNMSRFRHLLFVSSWCEASFESEMLWKNYAPEGVAISTTAGTLRDCLITSRTEVGRVKYIPPTDAEVDTGDFFNLAFWKRPEFQPEHECRVAVMDHNASGKGVSLPVDLSKLIQRVVVSPSLFDGAITAIQSLVEREVPGLLVAKSSLSQAPPSWDS